MPVSHPVGTVPPWSLLPAYVSQGNPFIQVDFCHSKLEQELSGTCRGENGGLLPAGLRKAQILISLPGYLVLAGQNHGGQLFLKSRPLWGRLGHVGCHRLPTSVSCSRTVCVHLFKAHCFIFLLPIVALGVQGSFNKYFVIECRWDMLIGSCPVIYRALVGVVEVSGGYIPQN